MLWSFWFLLSLLFKNWFKNGSTSLGWLKPSRSLKPQQVRKCRPGGHIRDQEPQHPSLPGVTAPQSLHLCVPIATSLSAQHVAFSDPLVPGSDLAPQPRRDFVSPFRLQVPSQEAWRENLCAFGAAESNQPGGGAEEGPAWRAADSGLWERSLQGRSLGTKRGISGISGMILANS